MFRLSKNRTTCQKNASTKVSLAYIYSQHFKNLFDTINIFILQLLKLVREKYDKYPIKMYYLPNEVSVLINQMLCKRLQLKNITKVDVEF